MAKVQVQVAGGDIQSKEADTIRELKADMDAANHDAVVNGEPQSDDYVLDDFEFVTLAPKVKGA